MLVTEAETVKIELIRSDGSECVAGESLEDKKIECKPEIDAFVFSSSIETSTTEPISLDTALDDVFEDIKSEVVKEEEIFGTEEENRCQNDGKETVVASQQNDSLVSNE